MSRIRRLLDALRPGRLERDIDRELAFHVDERAEQLLREGLTPAEARRRARRQFGNVPLQAERTRDADVALWLDAAARHLRLACRSLARTPGFTAAVVLTLALGIGANAAIFSALDAALLRPLPFPEGDRLVRLRQVNGIGAETDVAAVRLADWARLSTAFEAITSYVTEGVSDTTGDSPERVLRRRISELEPTRSVYDVAPLERRLGDAYAQNRLRTWLMTLFAASALGLVCAGVYGTLSYAAGLRRREMAVRLQLGALRRSVARHLVGTGLAVVAAATLAGLLLALVLARGLAAALYGVSPFDPVTFAGATLVVLAAAAAAATVPAVRTLFAPPMQALREE